MRIAVIGLGKMGLPMAVQYAGRGHTVLGVDRDPAVVAQVNAGTEPFPGERELAERLRSAIASGGLTATTDTTTAVTVSDVIVVLVPLYVNPAGDPDFGPIDQATEAVGRGLRPGALVIYETTLPVGTTRTRCTPSLELASGLRAGSEFTVAFSPERVFSGRVFADLARYPKLVGGIDPISTRRATTFYEAVLDFDDRPDLDRPNGVWPLASAEAAELAKLAETTYRDVNIALANQFAIFSDRIGVDFQQVIEACNSQPFSHLHRPGIAVGGHCIPVYPRLYLWNDPAATVVQTAREVNAAMPAYAVDLLGAQLGDLTGLRVVVLGAAYRGGVREVAYSGVFATVDQLRQRGAVPLVHDPLFDSAELTALGFEPYQFGEPVDAAIVQADHREYRGLGVLDLPGAKAIVDGRAMLDPARWPGVRLVALGRGAG